MTDNRQWLEHFGIIWQDRTKSQGGGFVAADAVIAYVADKIGVRGEALLARCADGASYILTRGAPDSGGPKRLLHEFIRSENIIDLEALGATGVNDGESRPSGIDGESVHGGVDGRRGGRDLQHGT